MTMIPNKNPTNQNNKSKNQKLNKAPNKYHKHKLNNKTKMKLKLHHQKLITPSQLEQKIFYDLHNQIYYFHIERIYHK